MLMPVNRQPFVLLPQLHGADFAAQMRRDLFPRLEPSLAASRCRLRRPWLVRFLQNDNLPDTWINLGKFCWPTGSMPKRALVNVVSGAPYSG